MKKTRKLMAFVLAVIFAFSSMPVVYTGTAAADAVTYAAGETGTLENPTRPVEASGSINREDLYKLNINSQSTYYTFYQTKNDEYFTFGQTQGLQNYYQTSVGSRTLTFESINYYEGTSGMDGSTEPKEISAGFGMWETPLITNNPTSEFLSKYYVSSQWKSTNGNAEAIGTKPENFVLQGAWTDIGGCKVYTWQNDVIFKGRSADSKGEINTGYYEQLFWNWYSSDASARFDLRIGTTLRILDARELAKEIAEAEDILENPEEYTKEYISSVEATLNTIPDDLRNYSKVYDQSEIDRYTHMLKDISRNSADYTEFNQLYKSLKSITNAKGAYTEESFNAFKAEIAQINAELPKNLDKTKQATVDAATQALRDAFDKLVATDLSDSDVPYNYDSGDGKNIVINVDDTAFYFMQTKDNQEFSYKQNVLVYRTGGSTARKFRGLILDESGYHGSSNCVNSAGAGAGTTEFLNHLDPSCYTTTNGYKDEKDSSVNAKEFTCVTETRNANWRNDQSFDTSFVTADGRFGYNKTLDDYGIWGSGPFEYRSAVISPVFRGNAAGTYGELDLSYSLRAGFTTNSGIGYSGQQWHTHTLTNIKVTDVRQLIKAVAEANQTIANPGEHSENYITALKAAVDSVPVEILRGVEYYTQEQVDKLYNDITTIPAGVADYSKFVETFQWMISESKDKYTEDSYNNFISEIYAINQNLPKNLTADKQGIIDEAVNALYEAHDKLISSHLNKDNVFTQDDITDLGNNPLEFSVSSTQYNFMQIADGQKFAIRTEITARNAKARYNCNLLSLRFSTVAADTVSSICAARATPDKGCHNGEAVTLNQTQIVLDNVTGITTYAINDAGDIGEHTTWVNTSGVALSTNGKLNDPTTLSASESSAYAEMYYTGPTGNHEAYTGIVDATFAFRLGWSYYESVLGIAGETIRRHAHIPVNIKITDARALNALYEEIDSILNGRTETDYTFESLVNLYKAFNNVDPDMAYGSEYFTQEEVNAAYAELKAAYSELAEGADYSGYFEAYVKAEEVINTNNADSKGNVLYEDDAFNSFVENVTNIENSLDKNLSASEENQKRIDEATQAILDAVAKLEESKLADYSRLNDAMIEAEKIFAEEQENPGTYTQATLDAIQEAYNNALQNAFNNDPSIPHKELHADQQAVIDAAVSALEAAIESKEYKADYSEFEEAYNKVQEIVDNSGKYTEETVKAAQDALAEADTLNKDLADTAGNRQIIVDATNALKDVLNNAEETADYTKFNEAYKQVEEIANDTTGKYTDATIQAAKDALAEADTLEKNLSNTVENQTKIDEATSELEEMLEGAQEKADYSGLDEAIKNAEDIVNAPDGTYTDETVKNAQDALDAAENLDKDLPKSEQEAVDKVIQDLIDSATNAKEKADYSGLDEAIKNAEDIVNAPDGTYTDETVKNAQDALDAAENLDKDLPKSEQETVDKVVQDLIDSATNAKEKADYTDYNDSKTEADNLVNDDGNGNPIYDEDAFQQYKDAVEKLDKELDKDLSKDDQAIVDKATQDLNGLRTELDASKGYEEEVIDPETTVDSLVQDVIENGGYNPDEIIIEFKNYLGEELAGEAFVGTGSTMRVIRKSTGELLEYRLFIVMGDVNGDGIVNVDDYNKSLDITLDGEPYAEEHKYFFTANDMDCDGVIDVIDSVMIKRIYR